MSQRILLAPGECLFLQGDEGRDAYIVVSGRIRISAVRRGAVAAENDLGPGEMLGELALIDGGARAATATAMEASELALVTRAQIAERMARADPVLALLLTQVMRHFRREIQDPVRARISVAPAIHRIRLEGELGGAISADQLELWFQPVVDLEARRVAGFEALVRWRHPVRGLVSPAEFIPMAEESGLIVSIGEWVLDRGAQALRALDDSPDGGPPRFMSVNVSGRQLEAPGFVEIVRRAVDVVGGSRLHLELTEGVLIQSVGAREVVRACKDVGAGLFLDDFGTGYSSLAYLNELPFDALKIDHSFAKKVEDPDGRTLILAIIGLARTLGREVVMEGVETATQRDAYRAMGGRLAQGYLFARPAPLADIRVVLEDVGRLPWG